MLDLNENKSENETVTIPKSEWEEVKKTLETLKKVADKGRLEHEEAKNKVDGHKQGRITLIGDKIVVGWKMKKDFVGKNQHGVWVEDQVITVTDEDGKDYDMAYVDFVKIKKIPCFFVAEMTDEQGVVSKKCRLEDGREIFIKVDYVN